MQSLKEQITRELTEGLNDVQREAVLHESGPLLIVAGAGSGKTRVITHRIAYLTRIRDVRPWNICAVTFTNKAAQEMRARLEGLMGPMAQNVFVRTFHSLGLYVLSRNYELAGLKSGFSILDQGAQNTLLKNILKDMRIEPVRLDPRSAAHQINRARDAFLSPADLRKERDFYSDEIADVYAEYRKRLRAANCVDFGDLLYETVRIFQEHPEVLEQYRGLWRCLMVDEYQDTNHVQYLLGRWIAGDHRNIMVVGDDDQSIYSWRGADISNILSFEEDYPEAKILRLEENYRSTPIILRAASSVIANNTERREKTLRTSRTEGETIQLTVYDDESEEARSIVSRMRSLRSQGLRYNEMAVFYRTNAQSRVFEKFLREHDVPYILVGDIRFYERKEIKDLLAYLTVVINPTDDISLERILNVPARGVGDTGLQRLQNLAASKGTPLLETLPHAGSAPNFRSAKKMQDLYDRFGVWRGLYETGESPALIAERVLEESGYFAMLDASSDPDAESRKENILEFVASLQKYEEEFQAGRASAYDPGVDPETFEPEEDGAAPRGGRPDLMDYLQRISLYTSDNEARPDAYAEQAASEAGFVSLMTLHNAKGLEFPHVFLTGLEEGYVPHKLAVEEGGLEEERRLLYVGITRAKERLYLSHCRRRFVFGGYQDRLPSRFLDEIDPEVLGGDAPGQRRNGPPRAGDGTGRMQWKTSPAAGQVFVAGDRVRHARYGEGVVELVEPAPVGQKLTLRFDGEDRSRRFLTAYTPLERL